jgi:hypothetical protein
MKRESCRLEPWLRIAVAAAAFVGCAPRSDRTETASGTAASDSTFVDGVQARLRPVSPGHLINTVGVEALRREGLSDPIGQIVDSLMAHREVIPHEGVLGGRMGFYSAQGIQYDCTQRPAGNLQAPGLSSGLSPGAVAGNGDGAT